MRKFKMGDRFSYGSDEYILTRTINYKDPMLFHFQLIAAKDGNRFSDTVVTHRRGADNPITLLEDEVVYLLELNDEEDSETIESVLDSHIKGPEW